MPRSLVEKAKKVRGSRLEDAEKRFGDELSSKNFEHVSTTFVETIKTLVRFLYENELKTRVLNQPDSIKTPDVKAVVEAVKKLDETVSGKDVDLTPVVAAVETLNKTISALKIPEFPKIEIPKPKDAVAVTNFDEVLGELAALREALSELELSPSLEVKPADVHVAPTDLKPLISAVDALRSAFEAREAIQVPETDLKPLEGAVKAVEDAVRGIIFPVPEFPARIVTAGEQPDGDRVNDKADGTVFVDTTARGANQVFTSDWFDTDGWRSIEVFIATDQVSASDGVEVQFTDDVQVAVPASRGSIKRTFSADDVARGFMVFRLATALDGFRVKYTNGGTAQAAFFIQANVRVNATESPQGQLETSLSATNIALMVRGLIAAKNPSGIYDNVGRGTAGGLDVGIVQHEVDTPIKALTNFDVNQANVGTSATQIIGSPLSGRKTFAVKALASNNAKVYVGKSGVTTGSGWELNASEFVIIEVDDTGPGVYAISLSGTQRVCWLEVA